MLSIFLAQSSGAAPSAGSGIISLLPIVFIPLTLLALGTTWFFASVGVFFRDAVHTVVLVSQVLMFMTPVFYPIDAVPERRREVDRDGMLDRERPSEQAGVRLLHARVPGDSDPVLDAQPDADGAAAIHMRDRGLHGQRAVQHLGRGHGQRRHQGV